MKLPSRRHFLHSAVGGLGLGALKGPALSRSPIKRTGPPRLRTALAAYSFREAFGQEGKLDMFGFIDYCAEHGVEGAELTSYFFAEAIDEAYLLRIKQHAFLKGVTISGTAVGNNFALPKGNELTQQIADVKHWVDHAHTMGAPHIRVFAGAPKGLEHTVAVRQCIVSLEDCCDYAGSKGIFLGLENHGGIVAEADALLEIVEAVRSPWMGINLDTGNFRTDDPYGDLAKCAPYAVNVQVKVEIQKRGQPKRLADIGRLSYILRESNYQGFVTLEYEAKGDPFEAIPGWIAKLQHFC